MKTRILHFTQDGDTSGYFPQLARFHDRSRYEMLLGTLGPIWPDLKKVMDEQGIEVVSLDAKSRRDYPKVFPRLLGELRARKVDIFHAHLFDPCVVGLPTALTARVPVRVMTRHYSDYHTRIHKRWHIKLDQMCTRLSHRVIAVSQQTKDVMVEEEKANPDRIDVIHNGIDLGRVQMPSEAAIEELRRELGLHGHAVLAIVARLHAEKGHEYLFRALPQIIAATGGKVRLLVAGVGTAREAYDQLVRELGIGEHVQFLGFRKDAPRIFSAADVVVLPSIAEAFGLVLAEAMYLGRAIVATRVGGIPEIIEDGVSGVLVTPADPDALAQAILGLLRDPERRAKLGEGGRRRVERDFRFETMMARYEAVYERLLRERKS